MSQLWIQFLLFDALNAKVAWAQIWIVSFKGLWVGSRHLWLNLLLLVDLVRLTKGLNFEVTESSSKELEFDKSDLVEQVMVAFVVPVQHNFKEAASDAEVYRFQFT